MKKPCACGCGQLVNRTYALGHHWKVQAENAVTNPPNPSGLCMCGCGVKTTIATVTIHSKQQLKGHPTRYAPHHGNVKHREAKPPNPSGLCMCGCGGTAPIAKYTDPQKGAVKGEYRRFIHNHHPEHYAPETGYKIEDRGYKTPCWVWQKWCVPKGGYGAFTMKKKVVMAHRYFYAKYVGPIPPRAQVHHCCFVTACVNPDHLEAVTQVYNERHKKVMKLSIEKARVIRQLWEWTANVEAISHVFRVKNSLILAVLQNKIWKEGVD